VMIDGSLLAGGDGIVAASFGLTLRDLAIGNFAGDGVRNAASLRRVYVGVDPTGSTAAPNERGVSSLGGVDVSDSVISGNRRSGISVQARSYVSRCRIGVAAKSDTALPNGASGIFVNFPPGRFDGFSSDLIVRSSVIANHPHFGIAIHAPTTRSIDIDRTSIYSNGATGIDYGLDGSTPNVSNDSARVPNTPSIVSARSVWGKTTIAVLLDTSARPTLFPELPSTQVFSYATASVDLYANRTPTTQSERYLGTLRLGYLSLTQPNYLRGELSVNEDLRGQWITGVTHRDRHDVYTDIPKVLYETSEISKPLEVK
jgi:hypothetical protein